MLRLILISVGLFSIFSSKAQKVESSAYELMLSGLLSHSVNEIGVDEFAKATEDYLILDARAEKEFKVSHIEGATWVGYENFDLSTIEDMPKDKPVLVYCSVGYRSEKIAEKLEKAGFKNVTNLYGGIFEWKNQGHSVVDTSQNETERVHAYSRSWGIWLNKGKKVYE